MLEKINFFVPVHLWEDTNSISMFRARQLYKFIFSFFKMKAGQFKCGIIWSMWMSPLVELHILFSVQFITGLDCMLSTLHHLIETTWYHKTAIVLLIVDRLSDYLNELFRGTFSARSNSSFAIQSHLVATKYLLLPHPWVNQHSRQ